MNRRNPRHTICCLLAALVMLLSLSGCVIRPVPVQISPVEPTSTAASEPEQESTAPTEAPSNPNASDPDRGPMPENALSWQEAFWDRKLPAAGYILPDEAAFYFKDDDGNGSVLVMRCEELLERVAAMGSLPRTRFFEDMLDERFTVLFACFDLATELGSGMFCFPTHELRSGDVTKIKNYISYSFSSANGSPQYNVSKDFRDEAGAEFRYMTVQLTHFELKDYRKYVEAIAEARRIVGELPPELSELEKAKRLYAYVSSTVSYDSNNYYEETDWSTLYDALIRRSTVCTGYAEAIYCLFNLAGIDCLYLCGSVVQSDHSTEFHAWNEAKINGKWYIFDATWDSSLQREGLAGEGFAFFGLSDSMSDYYAVRKPWSFMASVAPACNGILDPDNLLILEYENP